MDFINGMIETYRIFFSWDANVQTLTQPESWAIIGTLIILEGLLYADNALVLAVMVKHLPEKQRKKALFYGILVAYVFRFLAIGFGVLLVKLWIIKIVGALYLLHISFKGLGIYSMIDSWIVKSSSTENDGNEEQTSNNGYGFWRTVLAVELINFSLSIDTAVDAFGVSDEFLFIFLGLILGVLIMRFVAVLYLKLFNWAPALEKIAYVIVAIIGVKMIIDATFNLHIPHIVFIPLIIILFIGPIIQRYFQLKNEKKST